MVEKKLQEVTAQLSKVESKKMSTEAPLKVAERQAETQQLQLCQVEKDYSAAKKLIESLQKSLKRQRMRPTKPRRKLKKIKKKPRK